MARKRKKVLGCLKKTRIKNQEDFIKKAASISVMSGAIRSGFYLSGR